MASYKRNLKNLKNFMTDFLLFIFNRTAKWLYPGLGIKRWVLLMLVGVLLIFGGTVLFLGEGAFAWLASLLGVLKDYAGGYRAQHGIFIMLIGIILLVLGAQKTLSFLSAPFLSWQKKKPVELLFIRHYLERGPKVVAIGGGTGLSTLLRGLKEYTSNITAVVTVTDDGGSSGRLRGELVMPPPGDIRACLLALADTEPLMERLFQHRFRRGESLNGHNFGNLFIAAMTEMLGFEEALKEFSKVLAVRGKVLPVTLDNIRLVAEDEQGNTIRGETNISRSNSPVRRLTLDIPDCHPLPEVLQAIHEAEVIVIGPGSLLTSLLPNLLVPSVAEALRKSQALRFYVCNIMTQPGETDGFSAADHLELLQRYAGQGLVEHVIVNTDRHLPRLLLERYRDEGAIIVEPDYSRLNLLGVKVIAAPLVRKDYLLRHDSQCLARLIIEKSIKSTRLREKFFGGAFPTVEPIAPSSAASAE